MNKRITSNHQKMYKSLGADANSIDMSLYKKLNSQVSSKMLNSTVLITIVYGQNLHQFGTGTLLRIADSTFLITAAHVVKKSTEQNKSLCISVGDSFIQIYGVWYYSTNKSPVDVAALRLSNEIVTQLDGAEFIHLHDVDFSDGLEKSVFCLYGYPSDLSSVSTSNDTTMNSIPIQYITYPYEGDTVALENYDGKYHILLNAESPAKNIKGKPARISNFGGKRFRFPQDVGGISGCSIWKLGSKDKPWSEWKPSDVKVVAIQTSIYSDKKIIKATKWAAVSNLLYEVYADLRSAMELYRI